MFLEPKRWLGFFGSLGLCIVLAAALPTSPVEGVETVGHWSSILPPVLAILMAMFFRQLTVALTSGVVLGAFLAYGPSPVAALSQGARTFIWENLTTEFNAYVMGFTVTLVGMVHVMTQSGGMHGMVDRITGVARSQRSTRLGTVLMGFVMFFDDYANSLVVGTTMRSLTDHWRISREKLAYLVDSTSAPIAGTAVLSTWIAYEVGLFNDIGKSLELGRDGYEIFLMLLPFRFYCVTALLFVFIGTILGRDFGPMYRAESRAVLEGKVMRDGAVSLTSQMVDEVAPPPEAARRWYNGALPIACVVVGVIGGILFMGRGAVFDAGLSFSLLDGAVWRTAFGAVGDSKAGSSIVLFSAAAAGSIVAIGLAVFQKILTLKESVLAWGRGVVALRLAVVILVLAWAMKSVCADTLHTETFLISVLGDRLPPLMLPLATFLLAAGVAFATGTSWGTMGILLPVALPLAHAMTPSGGADGAVFWLTAAAVLDGAIFGDHCSPISDTTVLSSIASGCDHMDHVATQAPYAFTAMVIAGSAGYLGAAQGLALWMVYALIVFAALAVFLMFGKRLPVFSHEMESPQAYN